MRTKRIRRLLCGAMVSIALVLPSHRCLAGQQPVQADAVVIEGTTVIDGRGGTPLRDGVVVVSGGRIRGVGRRGEVRAEVRRQAAIGVDVIKLYSS